MNEVYPLRVTYEEVKNMLSIDPEVPIDIECLMDEKGVRMFLQEGRARANQHTLFLAACQGY